MHSLVQHRSILRAHRRFRPGNAGQIREVVPYGFDPAVLATSNESSRKRDELLLQRGARPLILTVGRHVYYKGLDVLIRAMQGLDAELWIGGHGPLTKTLNATRT